MPQLLSLRVFKMTFKSFRELGKYWFQFISQSKKSSYATHLEVKESRQEIERFARENRCIGYHDSRCD